MSTQETMEIINDIALQLGVATRYIIPEFARAEIAQNAVLSAQLFVALVISTLYLTTKRAKESFDDHNSDYVGAVLALFACIALPASFIMLMISIHSLVGWLVSPTAKTIMYVMRLAK